MYLASISPTPDWVCSVKIETSSRSSIVNLEAIVGRERAGRGCVVCPAGEDAPVAAGMHCRSFCPRIPSQTTDAPRRRDGHRRLVALHRPSLERFLGPTPHVLRHRHIFDKSTRLHATWNLTPSTNMTLKRSLLPRGWMETRLRRRRW